MHLYDIEVSAMDGKPVKLSEFAGKVLLIVNTATHCGFTPQYDEAPGTNEEIHQFCTTTYNISFRQFDKIEVNGPNASPLFTFLKKQQGFKGFGNGQKAQGMDRMLKNRDADYAQSSDIKWNFTKFVVDRKGRVVARFEPTQDISEVETVIQTLIR